MALDALRKKIETIDALIVELLARRQVLSKQIGQLKSEHGLEIEDQLREKQLFAFHQKLAEKHYLNDDFIRQLFELIVHYSKKAQRQR